MKIKITQEYTHTVAPEWYSPEQLSGEGTLEEQICEYETAKVQRDSLYVTTFKPLSTKVEVVPE